MTFDFFDITVVQRAPLSPHAVRITFGGPDLSTFVSGKRDQRFKLFLPHPGQTTPVVPRGEDWYPAWRRLDPSVRAVMRTYTVAAQRPGEFDVDFALHSRGGPACDWARTARPGDRPVALGPTTADNDGIDFRPPDDTEWLLLSGDEAARPAVTAIRSWVGTSLPVLAFLDENLDAVRAAAFPTGAGYAWIAGESGAVRALRRHLVGERGFDKRRVTFTGYWRRGATEDELIAEADA